MRNGFPSGVTRCSQPLVVPRAQRLRSSLQRGQRREQQGGHEGEGAFHTSANPDAFACAAFGRGVGVVGVGFQLDDFHDFVDG